MKFGVFILLSAVLLGGCLSSAPKAPAYWLIEPVATTVFEAATPKFGSVRIAPVSVRAPYDGTRLVVLRRDGSVAFDGFNSFSSAPGAILTGVTEDIVSASGLFERVVRPTSSAAAVHSLEVTVTRLALDCKVEGTRHAVADVTVQLLKGREIVSVSKGSGSRPAASGDYSSACSSAVTAALANALKGL